jgi:hypothetical protein
MITVETMMIIDKTPAWISLTIMTEITLMQDTMSKTVRRTMLAQQMTTPMLAKTTLETTRMLMVAKTMMRLAEITMVAKTMMMQAETTTTNPAKTMLATTRMPMGGKTMTKQTTMAMLVGVMTKKTMTAVPTLTLRTRKRTRKKRLIRTTTMQMSTLHTKKQKIWNR